MPSDSDLLKPVSDSNADDLRGLAAVGHYDRVCLPEPITTRVHCGTGILFQDARLKRDLRSEIAQVGRGIEDA